jgi:hypothetical protein
VETPRQIYDLRVDPNGLTGKMYLNGSEVDVCICRLEAIPALVEALSHSVEVSTS